MTAHSPPPGNPRHLPHPGGPRRARAANSLADRYLPPYDPPVKLDPAEPHTLHGGTGPHLFMEMRYQMWQAMDHALAVAREADEEFGQMFGRRYGLTEAYHCSDADLILVSSGSLVGTLREVVEDCRARGERIGLLKIRYLRPFPVGEICQALAPARQIARTTASRDRNSGTVPSPRTFVNRFVSRTTSRS